MKKVKIKLVFILTAFLSGYLLFINADKEGEKNNDHCKLLFSNIEALAGGESSGGSTMCIGNGSIDCLRHKVAYKYSGFSLDDY